MSVANEDEIDGIWRLMTTNYSYITRPQQGESGRACSERLAGLYDIWIQLLADIQIDILRAAALQHISESKWFPSVAELRNSSARILNPRQQTAIEAWGEVRRAFGTIGYYGSPQFSDDATAAVVAELGWRELCMSECQEADRARFLQGYEAHIKRNLQNSIMLPQVSFAMAEVTAKIGIKRLRAGEG